jgi:hypothetical protein
MPQSPPPPPLLEPVCIIEQPNNKTGKFPVNYAFLDKLLLEPSGLKEKKVWALIYQQQSLALLKIQDFFLELSESSQDHQKSRSNIFEIFDFRFNYFLELERALSDTLTQINFFVDSRLKLEVKNLL